MMICVSIQLVLECSKKSKQQKTNNKKTTPSANS